MFLMELDLPFSKQHFFFSLKQTATGQEVVPKIFFCNERIGRLKGYLSDDSVQIGGLAIENQVKRLLQQETHSQRFLQNLQL